MIFDIVFVAVVAVCVILGVKRGFMRMILPVVAVAASLLLAVSFGSSVAEWVETKTIEPKITAAVADELRKGQQTVTEAIPDFLLVNAERFGLNVDALNVGVAGENAADETAIKLVRDYIHPPLNKALTGVCTVVLFALFALVLVFAAKRLGKRMNRSALGGLNRVTGGLLGLANGLVFGTVLCVVMLAILSLTTDGFLFFTPKTAEVSYFYKTVTGLILH